MKKSNKSELDFLEEFQNFIKATQKGKRLKKDGTKITKGTQKNWNALSIL